MSAVQRLALRGAWLGLEEHVNEGCTDAGCRHVTDAIEVLCEVGVSDKPIAARSAPAQRTQPKRTKTGAKAKRGASGPKPTDLRDDLLLALREHGPLTVNGIAVKLGKKTATAAHYKAAKELLGSHEIRKLDNGRVELAS